MTMAHSIKPFDRFLCALMMGAFIAAIFGIWRCNGLAVKFDIIGIIQGVIPVLIIEIDGDFGTEIVDPNLA